MLRIPVFASVERLGVGPLCVMEPGADGVLAAGLLVLAAIGVGVRETSGDWYGLQ